MLERILAETHAEVERRKREQPLPGRAGERTATAGERTATAGARTARAGADAAGFRAALAGPAIAVIAEFKRRSPSAGEMGTHADLERVLDAYADGGAAAVSILTEGPNFGGSLDDLRRARELCALPLLRKDFIVDPYQLHEAHGAGADAVLLIVAALSRPRLAELHGSARALGLDALVEVHDRGELETALEAGAEIVGINNRDLRDFSVDMRRTEQLLGHIPAGVLVVSESGIATAAQVGALQGLGVHAVLVGESLMRSGDPARALRELQGFKKDRRSI